MVAVDRFLTAAEKYQALIADLQKSPYKGRSTTLWGVPSDDYRVSEMKDELDPRADNFIETLNEFIRCHGPVNHLMATKLSQQQPVLGK